MLKPEFEEIQLGRAEDPRHLPVLEGRRSRLHGVVARSGNAKARIIRDGVVVSDNQTITYYAFKDDADGGREGFECVSR